MAVADDLAAQTPSKRKNGRWARGSIGNTEVRVTAEGRTWLDAIRLAGLVMDWRPDLVDQVIAGAGAQWRGCPDRGG